MEWYENKSENEKKEYITIKNYEMRFFPDATPKVFVIEIFQESTVCRIYNL